VDDFRLEETDDRLCFENKSVPPMALLVSGGRISDASVPRIERFIDENLKGKANLHKILILEADGAGTGDGGRAKIERRPLTDAQQQDALFQVYDERNIDKVGSAFRLPRLLRGERKDFNRATAESALRFAEDQVLRPERDEFDFLINPRLLAGMGIRFWRFRSQTPVTRDPERMTEMVERLVRVGVLTPEEGRLLAGDIFNRELGKIGDDWTKRPITLTLAGIQTGVEDPEPKAVNPEALLPSAKQLLTLREDLRAEEDRLAAGRLDLARRYLETQRVKVPREEFDAWFGEVRDAPRAPPGVGAAGAARRRARRHHLPHVPAPRGAGRDHDALAQRPLGLRALRPLGGVARRRVLPHGGGRRGAGQAAGPARHWGWPVKLVPSAKRPCRLGRGEIRRVPQDRSNFLVGYHVRCLRCGFNTPALAGTDGLDIDEGDAPDDLTFSKALRCTFCRFLMHVSHGELRREADADVRHIRLR
jgi:hypothetical protein